MNQTRTPAPTRSAVHSEPLSFINLLSFTRTPGKVQILHIDLWYADGSTGEINITSPHVALGEDIERQYIYTKMYLQKSASDLGILAYQASVAHVRNGKLRTSIRWDKVDCTVVPAFRPGQYHEQG